MPEVTFTELMNAFGDVITNGYIPTDIIYHPGLEECPACFGEKQFWDTQLLRMRDCYWCQGRGQVFIGTAVAFRMGVTFTDKQISDFYKSHERIE